MPMKIAYLNVAPPELPIPILLKLTSFLFWSYMYLWSNNTFPGQSPEWHSRIVTLLHGSLATLGGLAQCFNGIEFGCSAAKSVTIPQHALMLWTWGYFAFDLLWCLAYWSENITMLAHHFIALVATTVYLRKDTSGCAFACGLFLTEVSNPLLQLRWFLKNSRFNKTKFYYMVEVSYLTTFIIARGVIGTYYLLRVLPSKKFDLEQKCIAISVYLVSIVFLHQVTGYVWYKYRNEINGLQDYLDVLSEQLNEYHG